MDLIALHYRIKEELEDNRFVKIYRIEDFKTQEEFIFKLYTDINLEEIKSRFTPDLMYELTRVTHPNLVNIKDFGVYDNQFYILYDYFKYKGFQDFTLKEDNVDLFYEIIVKICHALNYLDSKRLVCKGIKVENILFNDEDPENLVVKLTDYATRKIITNEESQSQGIDISLHYLAPEILQNKEYGDKTNLFSLGVALYKVAVGNYPYSIDEMKRIQEKDFSSIIPRFPSKINTAIDKNLESLLFKLIAFNPHDRFQNPKEVIQFINKIEGKNFTTSTKIILSENINLCCPIIREEYIKKLKPFVDKAIDGHGKLGFVLGDKGIAKKNYMQSEKFHILFENSLILHYHCDSNHKDPFFMLTKEIFFIMDRKGVPFFKSVASKKFQEFLFQSEEKSLELDEDKSSLKRDFELVKEYLFLYSQKQPIIYFISDIDKATSATLDFLAYIAESIEEFPFLVVASTYDRTIPKNYKNSFKIQMKPLEIQETRSFVRDLLKTSISKN